LKDSSKVTRRTFLAAGSLAMAGWWVGNSDRFSARLLRGVCTDCTHRMAQPLKPTPATWNPNALTAAWIGHATVLLNFYGTTILTDPVMFERCGFKVAGMVVGRKRLVAPALSVEELPKIDLVLLSHAHMDHMDLPTLAALPKDCAVITASRTSDLLTELPFKSVNELKWGEKRVVETASGKLEVEAFEVNHSGARWSNDTYRGYNGYLLRKDGKQVLFGGDTALSKTFKGRGKSDLGIMPIGSYGRLGASHCTPEQALKMANDAGVQHFMPVHHKTFPIGKEPIEEPLQRLEAAIEPERIALREIGETFRIG
jgi:L-ascorbate metabolism protein UlaG (beta-lactamase superfamily)